MASEAALRFAAQLGVSLEIPTGPTRSGDSGATLHDKKSPEIRHFPTDAASLPGPTGPTQKTAGGAGISEQKTAENRAFIGVGPSGPTGPTKNSFIRDQRTNETDAPHIRAEGKPTVWPKVPPTEELVEALAIAMSRKQGVTITDPVKAMEYLRASARNRLTRTDDPMVLGLLLGFEQSRKAVGNKRKEAIDEN